MSAPTGKTENIAREREVNVAYAQPDKFRSVPVWEGAIVLNNGASMAELWSPAYKASFPEG